ncbi:MAG: hypothetical protein MMC23_007921 [Stictis urceolatum]|nr:hypothetical protein [Stictis urceolata]
MFKKLSSKTGLEATNMPEIDFQALRECGHCDDGICSYCDAGGRRARHEEDKVQFVKAVQRLEQLLREARKMTRNHRTEAECDKRISEARSRLGKARQRLDFVVSEYEKKLQNAVDEGRG